MKIHVKNLVKKTVALSLIVGGTFSLGLSEASAANFNRTHCSLKKSVNSGVLCAVKPSITDPRISDNDPNRSGLGFGLHAIGLPDSGAAMPEVHIHFTGSFGKPVQNKEFASEQFLTEAMEAGKLVIQLAYDNASSVNLNTCNGAGAYVDNCAGDAREEKLTGKDTSPLIKTRYFDGIDFRINKLVSYLKKTRVIPYSYDFSWDKVSLSGHSQGGGMVHYIAKRRTVQRGCMIAGGYDLADKVGFSRYDMADWITKRGMATPKRKLTSVLHTADKFYDKFVMVNDYLGLYLLDNVYTSSRRWMTNIKGERITDGHGAAIGAVQLKDLRMEACFN